MDSFADLISKNEKWLIRQVLGYAKKHGYTKYTSNLEEAWAMSVKGLSLSLIKGYETHKNIPEFGPDEDFKCDPLAEFGVAEAIRHRKRGISLSMFLGLMKYYRQAYLDLMIMKMSGLDTLEEERLFVERSFDRIEIAFCQRWSDASEKELISELQASNRKITNEKNTFQCIFQSQADPIIIVNEKKEIQDMNHAAVSLVNKGSLPGAYYYTNENTGKETGIRNRRVREKEVFNVFPWLKDMIQKRLDDTDKEIITECRLDVDGEEKCYEVKASMMLDVVKRLRFMIFTLRDITAQNKFQAALKESERGFHNLFNSSIEGVAIHDLVLDKEGKPVDYIIREVNPAYTKNTGIERNKAVDARGSDLYSLGEPPYLDIFSEVAITGKSTNFETYFEPLKRHFLISVFSLQQGKFATSFRDITKRKIAYTALRESEQRHRTLFEMAGDAILIIKDNVLIDCNKMALDMFRCSRSQIISQPVFALSPEVQPDGSDSREKMFEKIDSALAGELQIFEWSCKRFDGNSFNAEVSLKTVALDSGVSLQVFVRDITERITAQKDHLEKEKLEGVLELAGAICHEFNQPLMAISGNVELFRMEIGEDSGMKSRLDKIMVQLDRMTSLIKKLMNITRYETIDYAKNEKIFDIQKSARDDESLS